MNAYAFSRETGELPPRQFRRIVTEDLLHSFQLQPHHRFYGGTASGSNLRAAAAAGTDVPVHIQAHFGGVNTLAIDKFKGRILVSGGADGSVKVWDLNDARSGFNPCTYEPMISIGRCQQERQTKGHMSGVSWVDFHPFQLDYFITGSFDCSVKQWSISRAEVVSHHDLGYKVNMHATSPIASTVMIACATEDSRVRLVDLRSGSTAQSLMSTGCSSHSVAWSPRHERILCSGHADGKVRIWDTRRTSQALTQLDMQDSLGIVHKHSHMVRSGLDWDKMPRYRSAAQAHEGIVNGLVWTDDGQFIVTAGLDSKVRVWNAATGANTHTAFPPTLKNSHPGPVTMIPSPTNLSTYESELLFYPQAQEIVAMELHHGTIVSKLSLPKPKSRSAFNSRGVSNRITAIAWRGGGGKNLPLGSGMGGLSNALGGIYCAHTDGQIRAFLPRAPGPSRLRFLTRKGDVDDTTGGDSDSDTNAQKHKDDDEDDDKRGPDSQQRKRKMLNEAFRNLTNQTVTFT